MTQYKTLSSVRYLYLVEFESGKSYVDVTEAQQSPEEHINQLLDSVPFVKKIKQLCSASINSASFIKQSNSLERTKLVALLGPDLYSRERKRFKDIIEKPAYTCRAALFRAAYIKALQTQQYEISTIAELPLSVYRTGQDILGAKYKLIRRISSIMPFGLNGYNAPVGFSGLYDLIEQDEILSTIRGYAADALHLTDSIGAADQKRIISLADIALRSAYFKGLSYAKFKPLIQFIPIEEYEAESQERRNLAAASLLSADDMLCGFRRVQMDADLGPGVSINGLIQEGIKPFPFCVTRFGRSYTELFVPWRIWTSAAAAQTGINTFAISRNSVQSAILSCVNGDINTAYGSIWRWLPVQNVPNDELF